MLDRFYTCGLLSAMRYYALDVVFWIPRRASSLLTGAKHNVKGTNVPDVIALTFFESAARRIPVAFILYKLPKSLRHHKSNTSVTPNQNSHVAPLSKKERATTRVIFVPFTLPFAPASSDDALCDIQYTHLYTSKDAVTRTEDRVLKKPGGVWISC